MPNAHRFRAKVLLEGIEVPFSSVTITSAINAASTASIEMTPHYTIRKIKPRTLVHVGVKDFIDQSGKDNWNLGFDGEVFARSSGKTPASRGMTIAAADFSNYWDDNELYYFDPRFGGGSGGDIQPIMDRDNAGRTTKVIPAAIGILSGLTDAIKSSGSDLGQGIKTLMEGAFAINQIYQNANARFKIGDRIHYASAGKTSQLLDAAKYLDFINSIAGTMGGFSKLREAFLSLSHIIFHDIVSCPFPSKVGGKINQFILAPDMYMLAPPRCNVIFPSDYTTISSPRDFKQELTRISFRPELPQLPQNEGSPPQAYVGSPISFANFLNGRASAAGPGSLDRNAESSASYGANLPVDQQTTFVKAREANFFTNEEYMQGIHHARLPMSPGFLTAILQGADRDRVYRDVSDFLFFKNRYAYRTLQVPCKFLPHVVPGFNVLFLDDSPDRLNIIGKCTQVQHIINHDSASTVISVQYARELDELTVSDSSPIEPPIPPWYDPAIFGKANKAGRDAAINATTKDSELLDYLKEHTGQMDFSVLPSYYNKTLGCGALTSAAAPYMLPAAMQLLNTFRIKKDDPIALEQFTNNYRTRSEITKLSDSFGQMGAKPTAVAGKANPIDADNIKFEGDTPFSGATPEDAKFVKIRKDVIVKYTKALSQSRGFRG